MLRRYFPLTVVVVSALVAIGATSMTLFTAQVSSFFNFFSQEQAPQMIADDEEEEDMDCNQMFNALCARLPALEAQVESMRAICRPALPCSATSEPGEDLQCGGTCSEPGEICRIQENHRVQVCGCALPLYPETCTTISRGFQPDLCVNGDCPGILHGNGYCGRIGEQGPFTCGCGVAQVAPDSRPFCGNADPNEENGGGCFIGFCANGWRCGLTQVGSNEPQKCGCQPW